MSITGNIAEFIETFEYDKIPAKAIDAVKASFLDYVGVTLAGLTDASPIIVRRIIEKLGGQPQATVWGTTLKTSVTHAAMANGTAAHALDFDDTNMTMMSHPSIQLLPALFAVGEYHHVSGKEMILAYLTGFEVGAMLGRAMNPEFVGQGWFPVGPFGVVMQTAACAKLLKLNHDQIENALGIAANLASGLRCNNGTMAKSFAPGHSAADAITAVMLAMDGMSANRKALEDQFGFVENFSRNGVERLEQAVAALGDPLEILQSGLSYKLYPCCAGTHTAIDCSLDIVRNHPIDPKTIQEIAVYINPGVQFLLIHPRPTTDMQAKFSLEYCVARAILDRDIGPEHFTMDKVDDPVVKLLIEKVKPKWEDNRMMEVKIDIRMDNGQSYASEVLQARGMPGNPLEWSDLESKFLKCAHTILPEPDLHAKLDQLKNFEQLENVSAFVEFKTEI
ncbi:MAG: MmgE/PrpD family protein [Deltaproteobacteria bacterium]|nr:MmgE/PrpD family protein [Deltaproteobacteria bacterium]